MSIRSKIISGFVFVFFLGLIMGAVGLFVLDRENKASEAQGVLIEKSESIFTVVSAHYNWRQSLMSAVLIGGEFQGSYDPANCALGKWLQSEAVINETDATVLGLIDQVQVPHAFIHENAKMLTDLIAAGRGEEAKEMLTAQVLPEAQETISLLESISLRYQELLAEEHEKMNTFEQKANILVISLMVVGVVAAVVIAVLIIRSIMKPLRAMTAAAEKIAQGDLEVDVDYRVNDEVGKLAQAFQNMTAATRHQVETMERLANGDLTGDLAPRSEKDSMNQAIQKTITDLNYMFTEINTSSKQVSFSSSQIAVGAQHLAEASTTQAASVEKLSSSIHELAEQTAHNSVMANDTKALSDKIKENAEMGSQQMDEMMDAVKEINEASNAIGKVIKIIDDIAFQTNILALNAAVEAARAGQHGKGFAVVADEVRNLAAKSAAAAKDTGELIEGSIRKAELGAKISEETSNSLREIVAGIIQSSDYISDIAQSSASQALTIERLRESVDQVAQVVQQNSATSEESAASSEEMNTQAQVLLQMVSKFSLKNAPRPLAASHRMD